MREWCRLEGLPWLCSAMGKDAEDVGWGRSSDSGSGLCAQDERALQGTWGEAGRVGRGRLSSSDMQLSVRSTD